MAAVTGLEGNSQFQWLNESSYGTHPGGTPNYLLVTGGRLSVDNGYEFILGMGSMDFEAATDGAKLYKLTLEYKVQTLALLAYALGTGFTPADDVGSLSVEMKLDLSTDEYIKCLGCKTDSHQIAIQAGSPPTIKGIVNLVPQQLQEASTTGFTADATRVTDVPVKYDEIDLQINSTTITNLQTLTMEIQRMLQLEHVIKNTNGDLIDEPACGGRLYQISFTELYKAKTQFTRVINATALTNMIITFPSAKVGAGNDVWTFTDLYHPSEELPFAADPSVMKPGYTVRAKTLAVA